jgi:molybdopterin molybdotransferase
MTAQAALPVDIARQHILSHITTIRQHENTELRDALDHVLGEDVISPIDVPAHDNSAMDGFAFNGAVLAVGGTLTLQVVGRAMAGTAFVGTVGAGQCVRIMTGAVMPADCDTVVPQELTMASDEQQVTLAANVVQTGENRRLRGEDLAAGRVALQRGRRLRPADLGLLASLGIASVPVLRRPRIAFFSTGDEICSLGEPLRAGGIYDSNRYTLFGMLTRLGCEPLDLGVVGDDPIALQVALETACIMHADAIVTSGGVSAGEADYVRTVMAQMGEINFWKLLMRPGRPMAFGQVTAGGHSASLFGLPGNPVAVMVTFYFFVRPALLQMMGMPDQLLPVRVRSVEGIRKKPGRTEYQRGIVSTAADGRAEVRLTGSQGAGVLRSMSEANCIVLLPHEQGNVAAGDDVEVLLFDGLV